MAGDLQALIIDLGAGSAPMDAAYAFGSIWVANHHSDDVVRLDPSTGEQVARIDIGKHSGPGWFAVTDDAVWVTRQNSQGMARIDPVTNRVVAEQIGDLAPCDAPASAMGAVWYDACDDGLMVRIDPSSDAVTTIAADGISSPLAIGDVLYASGADGMVRLDPASETWASVGGCCGFVVGYSDGEVWLASDDALRRVELASGKVVGTVDLGSVTSVAVVDGIAWGAVYGQAHLKEIDLATNEVADRGPLHAYLLKILPVDNALWITDFGSSLVWRITPPG